MAALQKIRKHGALLLLIIGLGLFAFIAGDLFKSIETTVNVGKQQVGEVYGKSLSVQDFQQMVEDASEVAKIQKQLQGQGDNLTDQENEQIRAMVWQSFVRKQLIKHEADKLGLFVTDAEEQEALRNNRGNSLSMIQPFFGSQQGGIDIAALQDFLKRKDQLIAQARQQGATDQVEYLQRIYNIWQYTEKELRDELLEQKFYIFLQQSFISNPVTAKFEFERQEERADAEVVAIPFTAVSDKDAQITDADLKAAYEANKERFRLEQETRDIKLIDIPVVASTADRAALDQEMAGFYEQLKSSDNMAAVVGSSKSNFAYSNIGMSKSAFESMPDVAAALDSVAVGSVRAPYYSASDNSLTTFKLISKVQAPDSILARQLYAPAATPEDSRKLADSILTALKGGAKFADLAKKYNQSSDSTWIVSAQFEGPGLSTDNATMINSLRGIAPGQTQIIEVSQGSIVVEVLDRKHMETKYNVAVVRRNVDFSKQTYNAELSKLNKFMSENRTLADLEKNAGKNGYVLQPLGNFSSDDASLSQRIGGTKDIVRWIFDDAKQGDISRIYEVGRNNDHLVVAAVSAINKKGYMPWDNESVKQYLTVLVKQAKKGEVLAERLKNVKNIAEAKQQKDAISDTLKNVNFFDYPQVTGIGAPEPKLAAALSRTAAGKFTGVVKGCAAVYMAQVTAKQKSNAKLDVKAEMQRIANNNFNFVYSQNYFGQAQENLLGALALKAKVIDRRYKF